MRCPFFCYNNIRIAKTKTANLRQISVFILSWNLAWIFYKLVNTTMSFQGFFNLGWQIGTYKVFGLQHQPKKTVKRRNQYPEEKDQAVFVIT